MNSVKEQQIGYISQLRSRVAQLIRMYRETKGPAKTDLLGSWLLLIPALASVFVIVLVLALLFLESWPIFLHSGLGIIFDTYWNHDLEAFGIGAFIIGSFICSSIAILIAVPLGLAGAIFLSEFCPLSTKVGFRMIIEMMAAIPSVVYGLWAATVLRFWVLNLANTLGFESQGGYSVLSGGLILAVMLLPTIVAVSDDALQAVPGSYREASLALGASTSETARKVVFSAALPGIGAAVVLSLGRAIGETMAILMVSGNAYAVPVTLFDPAWVMTSIIAQHLGTAYVEPLWRSAIFAIGFVLLLISIALTAIAKLIIKWGMRTRGMT